jgi:hypothetical protein
MTMALELNADTFRTALEKAATSSKLRINTAEMITVLHAKSTLVMAPLRDFDTSPATELPKGVDSVFAYVDSPDRGIPAGFYTLRVTAAPTKVGEIDGTVEYVDSRGKAVHKSEAHIDVHSLTLPDPMPFPHAVISLQGRDAGEDHHSLAAQAIGVQTNFETVIVCCPNGYCWFERK